MKTRLRLLGAPRLEADGSVSGLPLDRPASLGYYLAQRGDWVRRSELAYLYNPEADEASAFNNLRKLVFRLKQQGWAEALEAEPSRLRLSLPTDVQAFRAALERQDWAEALEQYGGTFLEGLVFPDLGGYEAWLELERQDLARVWRGALLEQVRLLEGRADWPQAELWLGRLLRADPLDEDAVQALLRVLQGAGKAAQAREAFERFRRDLGREMGVEPLESTRALADSLRSAPVAVPAEAIHPRHNLPAASTRFVGRKGELETLSRQLVNPDCRLLTLVGLGGMGKTRLALELANQQTEGFADGVWLVALAGVAGTDLLVSSIASALGLNFSGPSDPKVQLQNYLRNKELLLLLDNFEHLLEGGLLLEELLAVAPGLKLLVTSRVALETSSEWLYDLGGLPYPPAQTNQDLDDFDAVRLFVNRAERLSNQFVVTPATLEAIAELTRKVQGMPLALELAATWVRGLSVGEILARLSRSFELLQTTQRDLPERHRNLQAILEYSWRLLSEAEQAVLTKLSVFRGGFTLEAAQAVAAAHLGLLLRFINQALVRRGEDGRYGMHELVRQFAAERLGRDELKAAKELHAEYFADFLATRQKESSPDYRRAFQELKAESDNLEGAWGWMRSLPRLDLIKRASQSSWDYHFSSSNFLQGYRHFSDTLEALKSHMDGVAAAGRDGAFVLGKTLQCLGVFSFYIADRAAADRCFAESVEWFKQAIAPYEQATSTRYLGLSCAEAGEAAKGEAYLLQALEGYRERPGSLLHAQCLNDLSHIYLARGRYPEAESCLEEAIPILEGHNSVIELAIAQINLAETKLARGQFADAKALIQQAQTSVEPFGEHRVSGIGHRLLAQVWYVQQSYAESLHEGRKAVQKLSSISDLTNLAFAHLYCGLAQASLAAYAPALGELAAAAGLFSRYGNGRQLAECLMVAAGVMGRSGQPELASQLHGAARASSDSEEVFAEVRALVERSYALPEPLEPPTIDPTPWLELLSRIKLD